MDCRECAQRVDAWVDGELDALTSVSLESHLRQCPACAQRAEALRSLGAAVRAAPLYAAAPPALERRIRTALRREAGAGMPWRAPTVRWGAIAAAVLLAGFIGWLLSHATGRRSNPIATEVAAAHLRSLMADHLLDVVSTDRHTVKPWFAGKLDFSPEVRDCSTDGLVLQGGRLDYLNGRPVAALVYRRDKHVINLFVWPSPGADASIESTTLKGLHELHWTSGGLTYWAVSDATEQTLRSLRECLTGQSPATSGGR